MNTYNCLVAQSGGPTAAINASLAGVIKEALQHEQIATIYGAVNGIQGVLNETFLNLTEIFKDHPKAIHTLKNSPAMYLGSCRYKLKDFTETTSEYDRIFEIFRKLNIHAFFYIGGNDSMDTVDKLSQYAAQHQYDIAIIGIPKTIDNDLMVTDHTPGFGSAAKFVATSLLEIAHDTYIYNVPSVTIVEIMGRDAGWLTAASALARTDYSPAPDFIYLPECDFSEDAFLTDLRQTLQKKKNVIVAVSEGIHDSNGNYLSAASAVADKFGHVQLSGTGKYLEQLVAAKLGCKVRSIELNVLQRSALHLASATDLEEAFSLGSHAVCAACDNKTGIMLTLIRESSNPYTVKIGEVPVKNVANAAKSVPRSWINDSGNDVTSELLTYLRPLITGEADVQYKNGIPCYLPIPHLMK